MNSDRMNRLLQFIRRDNANSTPSPLPGTVDQTAPDSYSTLLEMIKERIRVGHSQRKLMRLTNTRQIILNRIWLLFEALSLEVLRDGWTVQNHRLLNHIKSVIWQLPDEAEAEGLEDALNGMLTY